MSFLMSDFLLRKQYYILTFYSIPSTYSFISLLSLQTMIKQTRKYLVLYIQLIFILIHMVCLFHKKLITSSTNTLIKINQNRSVSQGSLKKHVTRTCLSGLHRFFWLQPFPLCHFLLLFCQPPLPSFPSDALFEWLVLLFITLFLTKLFFIFGSTCPFAY